MEKLKSQSALHASYIFSNIKRASSAAALARTYIYSKNTLSRNRTYNCPLGGGCYIHLTKETSTLIIMYLFIITDVVIIAISFDKIVKNFAGEILYIPEATPLL